MPPPVARGEIVTPHMREESSGLIHWLTIVEYLFGSSDLSGNSPRAIATRQVMRLYLDGNLSSIECSLAPAVTDKQTASSEAPRAVT
jgi:hypothetical protein